ncbi:MAG TPA: sigma-70 family RNA polymerase sigma factor [Planctomycetota bacterium]|jgi:RNA polymerase sigma-70 factor (ECF subfamily)|nr:sigma-70 family RNA polymerase sigma factor [Planctomycetota bacterium]
MKDLGELLRRVLSGDRNAYSGIVTAYQDMLLAYAAFRVPDAALVDEVVQQTFIRAYEQLRDFQVDKDFGVWLRSICRFMILAELKRVTRDRSNKENYQVHLRAELVGQALARPDSGVDEDVRLRLQSCLGKLQGTARSLVTLRYQELLKVEEIADRMGQSATWVATTLFRVRETLRRCLGEGAKA